MPRRKHSLRALLLSLPSWFRSVPAAPTPGHAESSWARGLPLLEVLQGGGVLSLGSPSGSPHSFLALLSSAYSRAHFFIARLSP